MAVQRTEAWLKTATPEEIAAAHKGGELDVLLAQHEPGVTV